MTRHALDDRIAALRVAVLDFTPSDDPLDLEGAISDLSEDTWSARWATECEFTFWDWIMSPPRSEWRNDRARALALLELAIMARHHGGWYFWDPAAPVDYSHSRFVTFPEWVPMYEAWKARQQEGA